ncbi:MAG: hypothetical protein HFJ41_03380 [Clostridia bacterium]|nr:hypothetical protein [Clostridia bacterium]
MIKLVKSSEPSILTNNKKKWTDEYLDALNRKRPLTTTIQYRYRHKQIKEALLAETNEKCAYCECKIKHISYGDVEHILPKSIYPELYVEWSNLTLSCEICNRSGKHDYNNKADPLLNPYIDEPSQHLLALGPMLMNYKGSRKGFITIKILDLNRIDLFEKRRECLERISVLVNTYHNENNSKIKELLKSELLKECQEDKEFSFFVKSYLIQEIDF